MVPRRGRSGAILFAGLLVAGSAGTARAQGERAADESGGYRLRRAWTTQEGLPQNSVTSLAQTPDGFLWVGTHGGLARFDGLDFTVFNTVNTSQLDSNRIEALLTAADGTLWIGTEGGGCCRYRDGRFLPSSAFTGEMPAVVLSLLQATDGAIWLGGSGVSVVVDDIATRIVPADPGGAGVCVLAAAPDGGVLAAEHRLLRIDGRRYQALAGDQESVFWATSFVASHPETGVWGRCARGFFRLLADGSLQPLADDGRLDGQRIFGALRDNHGQHLIATGIGVLRVEFSDAAMALTPYLPLKPGQRNTRTVFQDREGSLWVGLDPGGLAQFVRREIVELRRDEDGIPPHWLAMAADQADGLWITSSESTALWHWKPGSPCLPLTGPEAPRLPEQKDMISGRDGTVWIRAPGALIAYRQGRLFRHEHGPLGEVPTGSQMFEDGNGRIWCGSPGRLHCFDGAGFRDYQAADGLPGQGTPRVFAGARDGALWFTDGEQVGRLGGEHIAVWSQRDGVPREQVRAVHCAVDGQIWIGAYGGGLACFRDGRFVRITSAHGLYDDSVSRIEGDDQGHLWINSNRGAFRVGLSDLDDVVSGRAARLSCRALGTVEGNGNNGCKTTAGKVVFPTLDGLVVIDPTLVESPSLPVDAALLEVQADGRRFDPREPAVVPPGRRDLVFRFAAPTFLDPENTRFRYRMTGLEEGWTEGGRDRTVRYASLPPGSYRFEVAALDSAGASRGRVAAIDLELQPFLHETRWFLGGCLLLAVGSVIGAYEWRQLQARRRRRVLEQEVARRAELETTLRNLAGKLITVQEDERARIARELHDDLNQRLALLAIDLELFTRANPVPRTASTAGGLHRMAESVQDISSAVHRLAYQLHPAALDQIGLFPAVRRMCENSRARGFAVAWRESGARRLPSQVTLNLFRVAQEALQNALRHSGSDRVTVELEAQSDRLRLVVGDAGKGFDVQQDAPGLGLLSMRERVRILGGRIEIETRPGHGARIVVEVPLPAPEVNGE